MTALAQTRTLGRSGLRVKALGFGASYGAPAAAYELAFERGCNYFYWGSLRSRAMKEAIRHIAPAHREGLVVCIQSFSRWGCLVRRSLHSALKSLGLDHADVLLLGWYNRMPGPAVMDAAVRLKEEGKIRAIAISCHHRPMFEAYIKDPRFDIIMVRYNAAHRGAEREVFPKLPSAGGAPGVITYTTTRWGHLIDPRRMPAGTRTPGAADCYRFVLTDPHVDMCLSGPSTLEQMQENLRVLDSEPMGDEELRWMRDVGDHVHRNGLWDWNPFRQRQQ
ncbi:MAG: aldo/keto reductase [Planctomycetes bacterium]|nr:aldo/keto reductase [Planctomycetota bacterium]